VTGSQEAAGIILNDTRDRLVVFVKHSTRLVGSMGWEQHSDVKRRELR